MDDNEEYKTLILHILKDLNKDVREKIYNILLTYEIIEIMQDNWIEFIADDTDYVYEAYMYDELDYSD